MPSLTRESRINPVSKLFGEAISLVGIDLVDSISSVLSTIPGAPFRPQQLAQALDLNKDLTSRLVRAISKGDPVEALSVMPGPAPLRRMLHSAALAGVQPETISKAEKAVVAFERLIRTEFGARADFDAAIAFVNPQARERQESTAKQLAYRGASGLRGITVDTILVSFLVHPSPTDPDRCDTAVINAYMGLRRTRPGASFEFATFQEGRSPTAHPSIDSASTELGCILPEFCSPARLPLGVELAGHKMRYTLLDNGIGQSSAVDIVTHERYTSNHPLRRIDGLQNKRWFFATTDQPTVTLVFDVFLHRDVWPGCAPALTIYDTAIKGLAQPDDKARDADRLDLYESIVPLENAAFAARIPEVPQYGSMLERVCGIHGWDLSDFRGHRTRTAYPFHGSQTCMVFDPFGSGGDQPGTIKGI